MSNNYLYQCWLVITTAIRNNNSPKFETRSINFIRKTLNISSAKWLSYCLDDSVLILTVYYHTHVVWHQYDVIKCKHFPLYWTFVKVIHRSPVNSSRKDQWRGASMFSLIYAQTNVWTNNQDAGDWGRHRAHYDVTVRITHQYRWFWMTRAYTGADDATMISHAVKVLLALSIDLNLDGLWLINISWFLPPSSGLSRLYIDQIQSSNVLNKGMISFYIKM